MGKTISLFLAIVFFAACQPKDKEPQKPLSLAISSKQDSISYSLGINLAMQLKEQGLLDIDPKIFQAAVMHVFNGDTLLVEQDHAKQVLAAYYKNIRVQRLQYYLEEGKEFLKKNAKRKRVKRTSSGLQYEIVQQGNGRKPRATQNVKCHYTGYLLDSTIIESTVQTGVPSIFPVNSVIPGMTEALQMMPVGSKWKLYIPTQLAYGERPFPGGKIKPNMALIYEIELLSIEPN